MAIDDIDKHLLRLLQKDARMSYAELGGHVGLSVSAVNERVKKLHSNGLVKAYVAIVDPQRVGLHVSAFVQVLIDEPSQERAFVAAMNEIDAVQEVHCITGEYGYLLKVSCPTPEALESLLKVGIKSAPGVVRTHTLMVLSSNKQTTAVPIE